MNPLRRPLVIAPLLGYETFLDRPDEFAYKPAEGKVGTYIFFYPSLGSGEYSRHRTGLQHLAFMVRSRGVVEEVHRVIVALGGEVVHEPREFREYHPGHCATFWLILTGRCSKLCATRPRRERHS